MTQQQLEEEVLALGNLVEGIVILAADMLSGTDLDGMVRADDEFRQVQKRRLAIEMGCMSRILSRRPLDGQLRLLVAMIEIAAELERLADHGRHVAQASGLRSDTQLNQPHVSLHRLASEVQSLLDGALAAFARRDAGTARTVSAGTRQIEGQYQQIRGELLAVTKRQPSIANQAIYLSRAGYSLRRAAQQVSSICDWVVFAAEGSFDAGEPVREAPAHPTKGIPAL